MADYAIAKWYTRVCIYVSILYHIQDMKDMKLEW